MASCTPYGVYDNSNASLKPKFHYAEFPETSPFPKLPRRGEFRGNRRNEIWAKGDVMGLSRTCRGCHGEVGIVEFGLNDAVDVERSRRCLQ